MLTVTIGKLTIMLKIIIMDLKQEQILLRNETFSINIYIIYHIDGKFI
jgi:hypothetical protein